MVEAGSAPRPRPPSEPGAAPEPPGRRAATAPHQPAGLGLDVRLDLIVGGFLTAGLSALAHLLRPGQESTTLVAGAGGGGLCVLWAVWGRSQTWCRTSAIATLLAMTGGFAWQAAHCWQPAVVAAPQGRMVLTLLAVLLTLTLGLTWTLVHTRRSHLSPPTRQEHPHV